jgi:hypothetical protein
MLFSFFRSSPSPRSKASCALALVFAVVIGIVGASALTQLVFFGFPLAARMASNADSLVLFDFARDLIEGHSVRFWNLPRAPYLFPDALIALGLMTLGWWGALTITAAAVINLLMLFAITYPVMKLAKVNLPSSALGCAFFLSMALLTMAICFPFSMVNIYWQIFASGAHFLSAGIVLLILYLDFLWQLRLRSWGTLVAMFFLCIATAVSDSLSLALLLLRLGVELLWRIGFYYQQNTHLTSQKNLATVLNGFLKKQVDLAVVLGGVVLGTGLSLLIPRQSLFESFFSVNKFTLGASSFFTWLVGDLSHVLYLVVLIVLILFYPACMRQSYFKGRFSRKNYWRSAVLAPALGIICITPFFYQDVGSIRYLAFPAFIGLISLALLYQRIWHTVARGDHLGRKVALILIWLMALALMGTYQYRHQRVGPQAVDQPGIDQVGLAVSAPVDSAWQCINDAKKEWPLADGVATYWYARPLRFATNFESYLAQIDQGRARSGAFIWGNNGIDLVYANESQTAFRRYNFIVTTPAQVRAQLWGNLPGKATGTIDCAQFQILYFENADVLWNYLFPLQVPFITSAATEALPATQAGEKTSAKTQIYWGEDLYTQVGVREGDQIVANGSAGVLVFGPYIPLAAGRYRLTVDGTLFNSAIPRANAIGTLEIGSALGSVAIAQGAIMNTNTRAQSMGGDRAVASIDFEVQKSIENVEFRITVLPQTRGAITRYQLELLPAK